MVWPFTSDYDISFPLWSMDAEALLTNPSVDNSEEIHSISNLRMF